MTATEVRMEKLRNNLEDLRNHSDNAQQMVIVLFPNLVTFVIQEGLWHGGHVLPASICMKK